MADAPGAASGRVACIAGLSLLPAQCAQAHAFGARYDLPLPLWLYLAAAGAAVLLSFVITALVLDRRAAWRFANSAAGSVNGARRVWPAPARVVSVALLVVVVSAAFAGEPSPTRNFAAVFVWVVWWVGVVFLQALVADVWSMLNPWHALGDAIRAVLPGAWRRAGGDGLVRYPAALGYWPACAGFMAFAWLEMVSDLGEQPRALGLLIVVYSVLTLAGAVVFGPAAWFARADPFAVVLRVFGGFAPLSLERGWPRLRLPGSGLLARHPVPWSQVVLVTALLATVSFDGFVETPAWAALLEWIPERAILRDPLLDLQGRGMDLLKLVKTVALLLAVALFATLFVVVAALVDRCSGQRNGVRAAAGQYVLTLVPIAVGYHVAHYLSYLLIAGQLIIPLASDPFALGWDLFGTRDYSIDIAVVDARFVWYAAVAAIVVGHVAAVCLSHVTALRMAGGRAGVVRGQIPMLVLMVGYTMTSLWILSQPIVAS